MAATIGQMAGDVRAIKEMMERQIRDREKAMGEMSKEWPIRRP